MTNKFKHFHLVFFLILILLVPVFQAQASLKKKKDQRYQIGVCDIMILKRQKISAFPLAKELGANGVEVDMGGLGDRPTFDNKLIDPIARKQFLDTAKDTWFKNQFASHDRLLFAAVSNARRRCEYGSGLY